MLREESKNDDEACHHALEDCPMIISLTSKSSFVEIERRSFLYQILERLSLVPVLTVHL